MKNTFEAVIFDMDGLIFDSEKVVQQSWSLASRELGLPDVGAHIYKTLGFNRARRAEYFYKAFGNDFPMADFTRLTSVKFQEIANCQGIALKPGVIALLDYLNQKEIKTAVATSSSRAYAENMLLKAELMQSFTGCIFGDMVTKAKPDPEIYLKACKTIDANPMRCIALEDSPAGIKAAYNAGILPIMVPDLVKPTHAIKRLCFRIQDSLVDVLEWLKSYE